MYRHNYATLGVQKIDISYRNSMSLIIESRYFNIICGLKLRGRDRNQLHNINLIAEL